MVKRLGHLQRMALGQRITVQGQQRLLVQAELLHLRGGEGGVNRLDGNPAQPEGPGRLPPDTAVDKQYLHICLALPFLFFFYGDFSIVFPPVQLKAPRPTRCNFLAAPLSGGTWPFCYALV